MRFVHVAGETLPQKQKWSYFLPGVFLSANSLNGVITFEKNKIMQYCGFSFYC